jgi:hypothetical protein
MLPIVMDSASFSTQLELQGGEISDFLIADF